MRRAAGYCEHVYESAVFIKTEFLDYISDYLIVKEGAVMLWLVWFSSGGEAYLRRNAKMVVNAVSKTSAQMMIRGVRK
jgi:hypothetical protein